MLVDGSDGYSHVPVMPDEVLARLGLGDGMTVVDGTVGLGGHSRLFGERIGPTGRLICLDRDREALSRAKDRLAGLPCRVDFVHSAYEFMERELKRLGVERADRVFLDLGVSSLQLDKPERGFSFRQDGPLDMRMDQGNGRTAADAVNNLPEEELARIFFELGEERFSRRFAKRIAEARRGKPIETTGELSRIIEEAAPGRGRIHPATRVFQSLRVFVNDELGTLSRGLAAAGRILAPGGVIGVLTFHSLEDRLVKRTFLRWRDAGLAALPSGGAESCGRAEAIANRRARSAKLRTAEKL